MIEEDRLCNFKKTNRDQFVFMAESRQSGDSALLLKNSSISGNSRRGRPELHSKVSKRVCEMSTVGSSSDWTLAWWAKRA